MQVDRTPFGASLLHQVDALVDERAQFRLERSNPAWRERRPDQPAQLGVHGRVEHHDRRRESEFGRFVAECDAGRGREGRRVSDRLPDVLEPGQHDEVVIAALAAMTVHRVVVTQVAVGLVGVGEHDRVVRVVGRRPCPGHRPHLSNSM